MHIGVAWFSPCPRLCKLPKSTLLNGYRPGALALSEFSFRVFFSDLSDLRNMNVH